MRTLVGHDIIVIGASAGGVGPLMELARHLPRDLAAAIFVVLHRSPVRTSHLDEILSREGQFHVTVAVDGEAITLGRMLVAQPDRHLLLRPGLVAVTMGPKENRHRPSIDALFRSASVAYGSRVVGVVLSGLLDDGIAGLWAIKQRGGISIVQEPQDAQYPDMPRNALAQVDVDHCVRVREIPALLERLVKLPASLMPPVSAEPVNLPSQPTRYSCPDCQGPLMRLLGEPTPRFECPVGHVYSLVALMKAQADVRELTLWTAVRALEEQAHLAEQELAEALDGTNDEVRKAFLAEAAEARRQAQYIRDILRRLPTASPEGPFSGGRS